MHVPMRGRFLAKAPHLHEVPYCQGEHHGGEHSDEELVEELGEEVGDGAVEAVVALPDVQGLLQRQRRHIRRRSEPAWQWISANNAEYMFVVWVTCSLLLGVHAACCLGYMQLVVWVTCSLLFGVHAACCLGYMQLAWMHALQSARKCNECAQNRTQY